MSNTLYLECLSGISGDMTVGALLDLGADRDALVKALKSLPIGGFTVEIGRVKKSGLDTCDFKVVLDAAHENHDHDMEYLHGDGHSHDGRHTHSHEHRHHEHHHNQEEHHHSHEEHAHTEHEHRGLKDILHIIEQAQISQRAKKTASSIFNILGEAESKAHGLSLDEVHFHEVGAVDSIVDIIAAAVCLDSLDITEVIVPELYEGRGTVRCQHGIIPVPVPAVMNIVKDHGLILHITDIRGELVTPTGAAIAAALCTSNRLPERFAILKSGMGAGKRNYERPSILRAMLIRAECSVSDTVWKLESNIDDCSGEALGYVMEKLLEEGARDVHYIPVFMKKNRPAYQLNAICAEEDIKRMEQIIFEETTTIGIRRMKMERTVLDREVRDIETSLGTAEVKICALGSSSRVYPEYDSVVKLCRQHGLSFQEVYALVHREAGDEV